MSAAAQWARRAEAAPAGFLFLLCLVLAAVTPGFATADNLIAIVAQVAVVGVVALALNQVIIAGEIDVSVGSLLAICAFVFASTAQATGSLLVSLLAALAAGALGGGLNAAIIVIGRVPSIIATLGTLMALRGAMLLLDADGVLQTPGAARGLGLGIIAGLPAPAWIFAACIALFAVIAVATVWGRELVAVGSNARAAAAVGLRAGRIKAAALLATGLACGLASAVFAGQIGQIQATAATGFELRCISAVVLGGTRITGGRGSVAAPVLGAALVGVVLNGLTLHSVPGTFEQLALGLMILIAIAGDGIRLRVAGRMA
ncbi:ABC transporter permease [Sphingomonas bacterium]|uniref:ABC transporter permease n=1 Tax=Sphingomonas bacterium TaxID=1895847 RepID=UPI0015777B0A|nr:ABC transporter permease [Sphingomonas bacterium]